MECQNKRLAQEAAPRVLRPSIQCLPPLSGRLFEKFDWQEVSRRKGWRLSLTLIEASWATSSVEIAKHP